MKKVGIAVILMIPAVFVLQDICRADPGTAPTVRIILPQQRQFTPGRRIYYNIECPCGYHCGSDYWPDNVFLRRLVHDWNHMGRWQVIGSLPYNTATKNFTYNILPGQQQADDWVITAWWNDAACWGQSQPFTIMKPGFRQGDLDMLIFNHEGKTLFRGEEVHMSWRAGFDDWRRVKFELLKRGSVVFVLASSSNGGIDWTINERVKKEGSPELLTIDAGDYADGNDFSIRITNLDTGETERSGLFTIKTPRLQVVDPAAGSIFHSSYRMTICWQRESKPKNSEYFIYLEYENVPRTCFLDNHQATSYLINRHNTSISGPCYHFTVWPPSSTQHNWPKAECFPFNGHIKIHSFVEHGYSYSGNSGTFTIYR
jgi:hypothetical protein